MWRTAHARALRRRRSHLVTLRAMACATVALPVARASPETVESYHVPRTWGRSVGSRAGQSHTGPALRWWGHAWPTMVVGHLLLVVHNVVAVDADKMEEVGEPFLRAGKRQEAGGVAA